MRTAIIHIGMHKTGSTSIQRTLASRDWPDFHYVREGGPNHSVMLHAVLKEGSSPQQLVRRGLSADDIDGLRQDWHDKLQAEISATQKQNVILSGEVLASAAVEETEARKLRDILAPHVDAFRVIGYVRPPVSLIQSAFQQKIKMGHREHFKLPRPYYRRQFEKFDTVFGRENVTLVKFDRQSLYEGDVVLDFAHRVGLALGPDDIVETNVTLSLEAISLLYIRNKFGVDFSGFEQAHRERNAVRTALEGFGTGKLTLSPNVLKPALDDISGDLDWIEARLGQPLRDLPPDHAEGMVQEEELLDVAAQQVPALQDLLMRELEAQDNAAMQAAEMADLLRFLAMSRRVNASRQKKTDQQKTKADRRTKKRVRQ